MLFGTDLFGCQGFVIFERYSQARAGGECLNLLILTGGK